MKNLSSNAKFALALAAAVVGIILCILFWIWVAGYLKGDSRPQAEQDYLETLVVDSPHTFANDEDAVAYGYDVCSMLDVYYMEYVATQIERDRTGILRGVSIQTKADGLIAAVTTICPEHEEEVIDWFLN